MATIIAPEQPQRQYQTAQELEDVSSVWRTHEGELLDLRFNVNPPYLIYNGQRIVVRIHSVDIDNQVITVDIGGRNAPNLWSFNKNRNRDGSFRYYMTLNTGQQYSLSFVRRN